MINKVTLIGNLGSDPELKYMPSGSAVANVSIATSETWKDKETGEKKERTEWHRLVFFSRLAEIVGEYCRKGSTIYVEGKLQTRKWQDKDGNDRYTTEIVAKEMKMLGSGSGSGSTRETGAQASAEGGQPSEQAATGFTDDIPFAPLSGKIY